tara:strand:+ start:303 stop:1022 length:720 start_codon:yes stop_codon:yes gene_type:complete
VSISRQELKNIIREITLSADGRQAATDALKDKVEDEGGAMGADDAKKTAEDAANVEMSDDEFEELAKSVGVEKHQDGDVVDTSGLSGATGTGLAESTEIRKLSRSQLREIIEGTISRPLNEDVMGDLRGFIRQVQSRISDALINDVMAPKWREGDTVKYNFKVDLSSEDYPIEVSAPGAEPEQVDFVKEKFEEVKESDEVKESLAGALGTLAKQYGSYKIPITVIPPKYDSKEKLDFDV